MDPLGDLIPLVAAGGVFGLFAIAAVERFIPLLPSYVLLVTAGIAAANGYWSLPLAHLAATTGGLVGCLPFFALGRALGEERALRLVGRAAWFFGASPRRIDGWIGSFRRRQRSLALGAQLVPTLRLLAPAIGGLLRADPKAFLVGTGLGLAVWNALFIGIGYAAARLTETSGSAAGSINASAVALKALMALLVIEAVATAIWRLHRIRQSEARQ